MAGAEGLTASRAAVRRPLGGLAALMREHWHVSAVLAAFIASMFIVPTLTPVAISDDWVYIRSVEILLREGHFEILTVASANLLFQVLWGALFGALFGPSLGVFRLSVTVLWLLSALAGYGLLLQLTGDRARSALGTAIYAFNPLGYSLAFSFMTDAPFVALLVIAVWCYARGLGREEEDTRWIFAGSLASACAILVRQPGVFIPAAAVLATLIDGRLRPNGRGLRLAVATAFAPAVVFLAFYAWLRFVHGEPAVHQLMQRQLLEGGFAQIRLHALRLYLIEVAYLGFFALPVVAGAVVALPAVTRAMTPRAWAWFVGWEAAVIAAVVGFRALGARMPYVPHFVGRFGVGPNDLIEPRAVLFGPTFRDVFTVLCALAALAAGLVLVSRLAHWRSASVAERRAATLVLTQLLVAFLGVLVVSAHFRYWINEGVPGPSLDRYLLPLVPLSTAALLWALRGHRLSLDLAWWATLSLGLFAVVGTRDNLVFHRETWALARDARALGIPLLELDGGASWDGYYVGEESLRQVGYDPRGGVLWWFSIYTPIIDPRYTISTAPTNNYQHVVLERRYDLWLDTRPTSLYLLRRDDVSGPP